MATLAWQRRDVASDLNNVKNTYSSWDKCMTETYCKWPAIIGIILAVIICLSILWCLVRCLCCGVECCCGCFSCCNACCPSPRRNRRDQGAAYYQQPPPMPVYQQPYYPQYASAPPPVYASGGAGYRGTPQTAIFDDRNKGGAAVNEDALPHMPSWSNAQERRLDDDDVELEKMNGYPPAAQQQSLLPKNEYYSIHPDAMGDIGTMHASPYQDYDQYRGTTTSPTSVYPPTYHTSMSPAPSMYATPQRQWSGATPSVPPSYHTGTPSITSPPPQDPAIARKPVAGSWRDI
ncbi:hypothetical protein NU219Hw_g5937t1 [Hortaea werneckii]